MTVPAMLQDLLFLLVVLALVKPLGSYMEQVFEGKTCFLTRLMQPIERLIYRLCQIDPDSDMGWYAYSIAFVAFSMIGSIVLYGLLRLQNHLPWFDSVHLTTPMSPDLAMNTAVSFSTTSTWQAYAGESTMSYFSQLVGLAGQNFLAGAAGLAIGIAFIRGLARQNAQGIGNF